MTDERALRASKFFLYSLLGNIKYRDFAVRFWDGTTWRPDPDRPACFTLVVQPPAHYATCFGRRPI